MALDFAGLDWGHYPDRYFGTGHVTVRVDPNDEDETPQAKLDDAASDDSTHGDDSDDDDDAISGVSGASYSEEDDDVPFGPQRVSKDGKVPQTRSLDILRRTSYHGGDIEQGEPVEI